LPQADREGDRLPYDREIGFPIGRSASQSGDRLPNREIGFPMLDMTLDKIVVPAEAGIQPIIIPQG